MKKAIIIFTRVPFPGQTKTRMMPYLTEKECADLHRCFLEDIGAECQEVDADLFVYYTDDRKEILDWNEDKDRLWKKKRRILLECFGKDVLYCIQSGENLGDRMYQAIKEVLAKGLSHFCGFCSLLFFSLLYIKKYLL